MSGEGGDRAFDVLVAEWLCSEGDADTARALEEALRADPARRRRFLHHCTAEMALAEAAKGLVAAHTTSAFVRLRQPARSRRRRSARSGGRARVSITYLLPPTLVAAAGIILAVLALQRANPVVPQAVSPPVAQAPVAQAPEATTGLQVAEGTMLQAGRRFGPGQAVPFDSRMSAGPEGAILVEQPHLWIRVEAGSNLTIPVGAGSLTLDEGRIELAVAGPLAVPGLQVRTSESEATVLGTRFSLERRGGLTRTTVEEGKVRVAARGREQILGPGAFIVADAGGLLTPERLQLIVYEHGVAQPVSPGNAIVLPASGANLQVEGPPAVVSLRAWWNGALIKGMPSRPTSGLEIEMPLFVWGDTDGVAHLQSNHPGQHMLRLEFYSDEGLTLAMPAVELAVEVRP